MANTVQANKRARQALVRRAQNMSYRSSFRTAMKKVTAAISDGNKDLARSAFISFQSVVDSVARKGIIHQNKAARYKSRLSAAIKKLEN